MKRRYQKPIVIGRRGTVRIVKVQAKRREQVEQYWSSSGSKREVKHRHKRAGQHNMHETVKAISVTISDTTACFLSQKPFHNHNSERFPGEVDEVIV